MNIIHNDQNQAFDAIHTILNSLDALVYVSDLHTYELLYLNDYGAATVSYTHLKLPTILRV